MSAKLLYITMSILLATLFLPENTFSQNCTDFQKKCQSAPRDFKASSLSRAFSLKKMKKMAIKQTLFAGRQYHIAVCGKGRLGKIHVRVVADNPERTVLYDNAADNFNTQKTFQIDNTIPIVIEISAPHFFEDKIAECAGVSVSYKTI